MLLSEQKVQDHAKPPLSHTFRLDQIRSNRNPPYFHRSCWWIATSTPQRSGFLRKWHSHSIPYKNPMTLISWTALKHLKPRVIKGSIPVQTCSGTSRPGRNLAGLGRKAGEVVLILRFLGRGCVGHAGVDQGCGEFQWWMVINGGSWVVRCLI